MNVFIVPSWYPSREHPYTGIFFKEQARLLGREKANWKIGISLWGSHEERLLLRASRPIHSTLQAISKKPIKPFHQRLDENVVEFFTPAYTWTRKIKSGNIDGIEQANEQNLKDFIDYFGKPDIIHAHVAYPGGEIARRLSAKHQIPYVITEHMSPFPMGSFKKDFRSTLLPAYLSADRVLGVSNALVEALRSHGIKAQPTSNFIDDQFYQPDLSQKADVFTIAWVGRLEDQKQPNKMLKIASELLEQGVPFRLEMVGDGRLYKPLMKASRNLNDVISWTGALSSEEIRNVLQRAHVFVNTSAHENQPVSILEALSCGLPVISFDWEGANELIADQNGQLVKDEREMTQVLANMARNHSFDAHSIRTEFLNKWGSKKVIDELAEIYLTNK